MGNTPSSEQDRRTPRTLSKPRLGQLTTSNNLLSPEAASTPNFETRLSDTNLASPPPLPTIDKTDEFPAFLNDETRVDVGVSERPDSPPEHDIKVHRFATSPLPPEKVARRKSTGILPSATLRSLPRPKSAILRSETLPLSSSKGLEDKSSSRRKSLYDLGSIAAAQTIISTSPREYRGFSPIVGSGAAQFDDGNKSLQNGNEAPDEPTLEALFGLPPSEATLYPPARRRSTMMTPGVATRAEPEPAPNSKKNFRKSLSAASEASRPSSESMHQRRTSMPYNRSLDLPVDLPERGATPTESPFRQLGGMKFGSLHITNGAPVASPLSDTKSKTLSAGIAPEDAPKIPDGEGPSANLSINVTDDDSESKQQTPVNSNLSPAVAVFGEPSTSVGETPSDSRCSPFSPNKLEDVSPWTQPSTASEWGTLDLRHDGKSNTPNSSKPQTPTTKSDGVARSDSGNGSVSSAKSQAAASKDSGYSSSLSLKSLFGSRKKAKLAKEEKERKAANATADGLNRRPTLRHHSPFKPKDSTVTGDGTYVEQSSSPKKPTTETEKGSGETSRPGLVARLGSFKARKSQDSKRQKAQPVADSPVPDVPDVPDVPKQEKQEKQEDTPIEPANAEVNEELQKPKKLKKLLSNPRRRSMPNIPTSPDDSETVPSMPSDAEAKLQEHSKNFDKLSKRFSLRVDPSKDRPDSMIYVESREVTDDAVVQDNVPSVDRSRSPLPSNRQDKLSRAVSVRSFRPRSVQRIRKSRPAAEDPYDSDDDAIPDTMGGYESHVASIANIRRSVGNSAFDAGFLALAADNPYAAAGATPVPASRPKTPPNPGQYPRLRPRRSAPDFLETLSEPASPGSVDCWSQKKPKTPPPVTTRTRGSKKKRRPKSMQPGGRPPMPHPPMPGQFMPHNDQDGSYGYGPEQDLAQSLRSFPVSQQAGYGPPRGDPYRQQPHGPPPGRRTPARPLYPPMTDDLMGRYPPPQHQDGPMPPFHHPRSPRGCAGEDARGERRVLHSYNSPAYKGVPIWS